MPSPIELSATRRTRSLREVRVHHPRHLARVRRKRLPVTAPARTLLDLSSCAPSSVLRRALAEAFFLRLVDAETVEGTLVRGHPGSGALRTALARHRPQLVRTRSVHEDRFLALCEEYGIPLPEVNVRICGFEVDAVWREQRLIVELDSQSAHGGFANVANDRERELKLRRAGWRLRRYSWQQTTGKPADVAADVLAALGPAA